MANDKKLVEKYKTKRAFVSDRYTSAFQVESILSILKDTTRCLSRSVGKDLFCNIKYAKACRLIIINSSNAPWASARHFL